MHRKYTLTATKRLRVAETVSLGEKRFVALVSVEGREFLIGGGASGVSLLATLGTTAKSTRARKSAVAGDSV
jgi:flagellar biogenesis protein FliO